MLHRAGQCADDLLSTELSEAGLTSRQHVVLKSVATGTEVSQTDVVVATGIDRSTVADMVRRLVERGYLERQRTKHDARMYVVRLTTKGRKALREVDPIRERCEAQLLDAIPKKDRDGFLRGLQGIVETLGPISSAQVSTRARSELPAT